MQCARAIVSSVACLALENGYALPHKKSDYRKEKVVEHKKCVRFSKQNCLKHISYYGALSGI